MHENHQPNLTKAFTLCRKVKLKKLFLPTGYTSTTHAQGGYVLAGCLSLSLSHTHSATITLSLPLSHCPSLHVALASSITPFPFAAKTIHSVIML